MPCSVDEHPKLVRNPGPLTSHRILTHFWENCGYLIQAYIMPLIAPGFAQVIIRHLLTCRMGGWVGMADRGSSDLTKFYIIHW